MNVKELFKKDNFLQVLYKKTFLSYKFTGKAQKNSIHDMIFYTALFIGLLGGFHCLAMCGPLVLIVFRVKPGQSSLKTLSNALIYNTGRVLSYSFLGLIVGLSGRGLVLVSSQQLLSLGVGILILGSFLLSKKIRKNLNLLRYSHKMSLWFRQKVNSQINFSWAGQRLFQGILHGFLPCGTVYLALAGALSTGEIFSGVIYMFIFGLGTLPFLLVVKIFGYLILGKITFKFHQIVISTFALFLAGLLIIRALNLGIPYLSPKISYAEAQIECCEVEIKN